MEEEDMVPIKYDDEEGMAYVAKAIVEGGDEKKNLDRQLQNYVDGQKLKKIQGYQYKKSSNFPMTC